MKIEPIVLNKLYEKYKSIIIDECTKSQECFDLGFKAIEDQFDGYFDWGHLAADEVGIHTDITLLLQQSLKVNQENELKYDELNAKLSLNNFAQTFPHVMQLKIASPTSQQGIQEKFLKSSLEDVPLSKIDIQRHILQTHMTGHMGVVDVTSEAMGLYIANAKHQHPQYPVAMMVNYNPDTTSDPIWASVVITIDPTSNEASCEITSCPDLKEEQKAAFSIHIEEALRYKQISSVTGLPIEAYPTIKKVEINYKSADDGYRVLHQLYSNESLANYIIKNANASAFKDVIPELAKQAVIDQQIQAIKIEPQVFALFSPVPQSQHPVVSEAIQQVKITDSKITFPRAKPERELAAEDYQAFVLLLKEKFSTGLDKGLDELEIKCFDTYALQGLSQLKGQVGSLPFETLTLALPQTLEASDKAAFKFNLKLALMSLSASNLDKMQLKDAGNIFNEADIAEITDFIEKNDIAINLVLPGEFVTSHYQRSLDFATSGSILARNVINFSKDNTVEVTKVERPRRVRPKMLQSLSIDIELQQEMQVQVAVEAAVEKSGQVEDSGDEVAELYNLERFKKGLAEGDFSLESRCYLIPAGPGAESIWTNWLGYCDAKDALEGLKLSKPALEELMRHADKFQYGIGFLKKGDTYRNLPAGFAVKMQGRQTYIDFNPKLKLIAEQNLLAVQTKDIKPDAVLSGEQIQKWIKANPDHPFKTVWDKLLASERYDKQALEALKFALPKIALMPEEQAQKLFNLCTTENSLIVAKFNFLVNDAAKAYELFFAGEGQAVGVKKHMVDLFPDEFESVESYVTELEANRQDQSILDSILSSEEKITVENIKRNINPINMNCLLQLYLQSGPKALEKLSTLLDAAGDKLNTYQMIMDGISLNDGSYQQILTAEFQEALTSYSSLQDNEQQFFTKLFEQHAQDNSNVDFAQLMHTFLQFRRELTVLDPELKLPSKCNITHVKSMPLALARIAYLIQHVKAEDRQAQLQEAHNLDLSSTGMIQAVTRSFKKSKQWNFITAEMQLNQSNEQGVEYTIYEAYTSQDVRKGKQFFNSSGEELSKDFLRYVGFQSKKGSLNLEFYKYADEKIKKSGWSDSNKKYLYNLIAASATDGANIQFFKNTQVAIVDFNEVFNKINIPPNPGYVGAFLDQDKIREQILKNLNNLDNVPPLPVLSRLVKLISNALSSTVGVVMNAGPLKKANASLNAMARGDRYGSSVYKGMSCYQDSDYANKNLFYEHMATIEAIYNHSYMEVCQEPSLNKAVVGASILLLISAFHLNVDNLQAVFGAFSKEELPDKLEKELLFLLSEINYQNGSNLPALDHNHLIALVKKVQTKDKSVSVVDAIKEFDIDGHKLSEYFDARYLQNYDKCSEVPPETKKQIEDAFDQVMAPVVEDILLYFTSDSDTNEYGSVVEKLISICKGLSKLEQNIFLSKLRQTTGLYSNPMPLSDENNTFKVLLDLLLEQGSPDELMNFIASDKALFAKLGKGEFYTGEGVNQGLDKKALLFIKDIYPAIKQNTNLAFTRLEMTPRLHEWILKTPVQELSQESAVIHPDKEKSETYLEQSKAFLDGLKEGAVNFTVFIKALDEFDQHSKFPDKVIIKELQKKIGELQNLEELDVQGLKELKQSTEFFHQAVKVYQQSLTQYPNVVLALVDKMSDIAGDNPSARVQFLELFDKFVEHYDPIQGEMMQTLHDFIDQLIPVFAMIKDKNVILSLCMQFKGDEALQPKDLLDLITAIRTVKDIEAQKLLINVAVNLLNNKKGYKLKDDSGKNFSEICRLAQESPSFISTLNTFYKKPPYPDLDTILTLHENAQRDVGNAGDYEEKINQLAQEFDKKPCDRGEHNGFHVVLAKTQLGKFKGYQASNEKLESFSKKTIVMRDKSSDELLEILKSYRLDGKDKDMETLVAVSAELFYRSKGMEINTTQYLAILSSLETKGHVTSQIGTGEGKSRIMMISNVCQWALGNTVDFVTSDAQLATRDYVEYQAYFNMVGANTSMIFASSDASAYKIGGINFSDPSNLSLFRNKAKSHGKGDKVLAPQPERRALMLDEADKTYFDVADTRFNFSKEGDESIQNMSWMYSVLMTYFEQKSIKVDASISSTGEIDPTDLFYANVDASRESFLVYARTQCTKQDFIRLKSLSEQQIEQWQVSAVTASQLQFKKDFVISPDQLISTPRGPTISSEAQLLFANRVAKGSKFSFGVHQCLHARLNRIHQNPDIPDIKVSQELRQALKSCEKSFYIADEKQIVYSSTSKNLIDDYQQGTLKAVTGTAGSPLEREEAEKLYKGMTFIDVPRDKGMNRHDKGIQLCKDKDAQMTRLIKNIRQARVDKQPILIIAENDEESGKLFKRLNQEFPDDIQHIHSQLNSKQEQEKTKKAGVQQMITVSTDMIGRGTDIELYDSAKNKGLNVMLTYLPRGRDLEQIIGRSGRFGAKGETSLIIDKKAMLKKLGLKKLPKDWEPDYKAFIQHEQAKMDRKAQVDRLLKNHVGDFKKALHDNFFNFKEKMLAEESLANSAELVGFWAEFLGKSDKIWNEVWPNIQQQIQMPNITETELAEVQSLLYKYQAETQKEWTSMVGKITDSTNAQDHTTLNKEVPPLALNENIKDLLTAVKVSKKEVPHDPNRYMKIFTGVLAFIVAAIGIALIATGILAPIGGIIAGMAVAAVVGQLVGGSLGLYIGAKIDDLVKPEPREDIEIRPIKSEDKHTYDKLHEVLVPQSSTEVQASISSPDSTPAPAVISKKVTVVDPPQDNTAEPPASQNPTIPGTRRI